MEDKKFLIPISGRGKGQFAIVDEEDYKWASTLIWHLNSAGRPSRSCPPQMEISLGREIVLRLHDDFEGTVRYYNNDKLDCRRSNIKVVYNNRSEFEIINDPDGSTYARIPVSSSGASAMVDTIDYKHLIQHQWYELKTNGSSCAWTREKGCMHRVIMERIIGKPLEKGMTVGHLSENKLDNRRKNLYATLQNMGNIDHRSGYAGVFFSKTREKWIAYITVNVIVHRKKVMRKIYLGSYSNKEEAVAARKEGEDRYQNEFS